MSVESSIQELINDDAIIVQGFDYWVRERGDSPFVLYGEDDITYSYAEFAALTDNVAGNLAALGIGKGDHVSVFVYNSLVSAIAMFGIWKAGAVFCPINFSYAGRLLAYQLNDTRPSIIITERKMVGRLNEVRDQLGQVPRVVVFDAPDGAHDYIDETDRPDLDPQFELSDGQSLLQDATRPQIELAHHDICNIIYTSGTTGPSKGVVQSYRWMNQYTFLLRKMLTADDVVYNDLPLYHIGGAIANVAKAAWAGCSVALWDKFSPGDFWRRIERSRATSAILLDVMIPWLMNAPAKPDDNRNSLNKVHMQPLPQHHNEVARRFGFDFVTAGFAQTESGASVMALMEEVPEGEGTPFELYRGQNHSQLRALVEGHGVPCVDGTTIIQKGFMGLPSFFMEVQVQNELDEPCAPAEVGHLCIRPKLPWLLCQEYLGKPEATLKAFRNLWFHTGDAAYQSADGIFYFVDRLGDRIRRRGENTSSYHIEDLLNQHAEVQFCAAFPIPSSEGGEDDIVAFVVPKPDSDLTTEALSNWATSHMPKFMQPSYFRLVEDIPRTPTNKVEKYKLRQQILAELGRV